MDLVHHVIGEIEWPGARPRMIVATFRCPNRAANRAQELIARQEEVMALRAAALAASADLASDVDKAFDALQSDETDALDRMEAAEARLDSAKRGYLAAHGVLERQHQTNILDYEDRLAFFVTTHEIEDRELSMDQMHQIIETSGAPNYFTNQITNRIVATYRSKSNAEAALEALNSRYARLRAYLAKIEEALDSLEEKPQGEAADEFFETWFELLEVACPDERYAIRWSDLGTSYRLQSYNLAD